MSNRGIPKPKTKNYLRKSTRITYTDTDSGFAESNTLLLGSEIVVIQIDKTNKVFRVLDARTKKLCFSLGQGEDVADCKRNARAILIKNSASLLDEVRVKRKT